MDQVEYTHDRFSKRFQVGRLHYVVSYENGSFEFYIDLEKSRDVSLCVYDPFERWGTALPSVSFSRADCESVFTVKREVTAFVDAALKKFKPNYFTFGAFDGAFVNIYARFAWRLSNQYGYTVIQQGKSFIVYRRDKSLSQ